LLTCAAFIFLLIKYSFDLRDCTCPLSGDHSASVGLSNTTNEVIRDPSFEVAIPLWIATNLAKPGLLERSCLHEIMGLGREEPAFDHTRDSHRRRCDCVRAHRAARANARGLLGCDRYLGRDAIHSRRDADALDRTDRRYRGGRVGRSARGKFFGANLVAFAVAIVLIGLLSIAFRLEKIAYRYASITLAIIVLIPRSPPAWIIARHRFLEVSVGIIVALTVVAL
jgi:hypothetical protein